jgi:hypothetical protein
MERPDPMERDRPIAKQAAADQIGNRLRGEPRGWRG